MLRASNQHVGSIIANHRAALANRRPARAAVVALLVGAGVLAGTGATANSAANDGAWCRGGNSMERTVRYESVRGAAPRLTSLDVYGLPAGCGAPVLVWVHGGGWQIGDKSNQIADRVRWAGDHGWVLVSVNYRLTDPQSPTPVVYPTHNEDVAAAVAWVHDH